MKSTAAKKISITAAPKAKKSAPRAPKAVAVSYYFCVDDAPDDKCFWVNHGPVVRNLAELQKALSEMTDEQFRYHTTERDINDFATWIEGVLGHSLCAKKIARAKTRATAIRALDSCDDK